MCIRDRDLILQKMRDQGLFVGWGKGPEREGESDGVNAQRKQRGLERRDWPWTEEPPCPRPDRKAGVDGVYVRTAGPVGDGT